MYVDVYLPSIWRHVAYGHNYLLSHELPAHIIVMVEYVLV